jgi:hypothetical protein
LHYLPIKTFYADFAYRAARGAAQFVPPLGPMIQSLVMLHACFVLQFALSKIQLPSWGSGGDVSGDQDAKQAGKDKQRKLPFAGLRRRWGWLIYVIVALFLMNLAAHRAPSQPEMPKKPTQRRVIAPKQSGCQDKGDPELCKQYLAACTDSKHKSYWQQRVHCEKSCGLCT